MEVPRAGPNLGIEPRDGFEVVVKHVEQYVERYLEDRKGLVEQRKVLEKILTDLTKRDLDLQKQILDSLTLLAAVNKRFEIIEVHLGLREPKKPDDD